VNTNPIRFGLPGHLLCFVTVSGDARDELPAAEVPLVLNSMELSWIRLHHRVVCDKVTHYPYFYSFFVASGLSALLNKRIDDQLQAPFKVFRRARGVSHVFYIKQVGIYICFLYRSTHKSV
jgi:hypothetical protein